MKKILSLALGMMISLSVQAQTDVVPMKSAIQMFKAKTLANAKQVLQKEGYAYKGVSSDSYGKDYNWVKNMDLSASFLPTRFQKGNSSLVMQSVDGKAIYVYVFNRTVFGQLQGQVKAMGYDMGKAVKSGAGTIVCTKDNEPTVTFLTLQMPLPYCVQITE